MMEGEKIEVTRQEFQMCQDHAREKFQNDKERLNGHSREIGDLTVLVAKMTEFVELQRQTNEDMAKRIRLLEERPKQPAFYQCKWFDWVIKGLVIIAVLITGAAVGGELLVKILQNNPLGG
jgi:hypothetical protein